MGVDGSSESNLALRRALQKLTHGDGVQRTDLIDALSGELQGLQLHWNINLANGLRVAQRSVSLNLNAYIERLTPRPWRDELTAAERREQYLHAIKICFNTVVHPDLQGKDLTRRQKWLAEDAPRPLRIDKPTCRRDLAHAIAQIEQQILASSGEPSQPPLPEAVNPTTTITRPGEIVAEDTAQRAREPYYIPRTQEFRKIDARVEAGYRLIAISGRVGSGTSTVARTYVAAREPDPTKVLYIDYRRRGHFPFYEDLAREAVRLGAKESDPEHDPRIPQLATIDEIIASVGNRLRYVVLDNVPHWEVAEVAQNFAASQHFNATILAVTDTVPPSGVAWVSVLEMADEEVELLARHYLLGVSSRELAVLRMLKESILVVDLCCIFLSDKQQEFRTSFLQSIEARVNTDSASTVRIFYAELMHAMEADPQTLPAVRLLELIAAQSILTLDANTPLMDVLASTLGIAGRLEAEETYAAAVSTLDLHGLLYRRQAIRMRNMLRRQVEIECSHIFKHRFRDRAVRVIAEEIKRKLEFCEGPKSDPRSVESSLASGSELLLTGAIYDIQDFFLAAVAHISGDEDLVEAAKKKSEYAHYRYLDP